MIKLKTLKEDQNLLIFVVFSVAILAAIFLGIALENILFLLIPIGCGVVFITLTDVFKIYHLFFLLIPFSIEFTMPNGLGTDLPSEPLMIGLSIITIFYLANNVHKITPGIIGNPIVFLLLLHVIWIFYTSINSQNPTISFKYLLAKIWYVLPFFVLPFFVLTNRKNYRRIFKALSTSMFIVVTFVMVKHATLGFTFKDINAACSPIFRNHVNYACILIISMPIIWTSYKWAKKEGKGAKWFMFLMIYFVLGIYLTFTRAAMVALLLAIIAYFLLKIRMLRTAVFTGVVLSLLGVSYLIQNDNYVNFSPNYEQTVTHYTFDDIVEATYKLKDISTMERVNRWVAGYRMVEAHPWAGFGPATFYSYYKGYLETLFKTYVTDNPEKSGIHNYYLMVTVEQGIIGGAIFLLLCVVSLFQGIELYYKMIPGHKRDLVLMAILMLVVICAILIINDMIETAKVGPFFFLALSILAREKIYYVRSINNPQKIANKLVGNK